VTATDRIRLFAAVDLPAAVRAAIGDWALGALGDRDDVRRLREDTLHLTVCFLGARPAAAVPGIAAACREVGADSGVLGGSRPVGGGGPVGDSGPVGGGGPQMTLGDVLWLPPRRPHALAVGIVDRDGRLGRLHAALSGALSEAGVHEPEARPFRPHVTIARPRGRSLRRTDLPAPPALDFTAASVSLYRSHTGAGGARYEALETVVL
jgi:RNA 2',3'-cyclic 3'-phosphodiesterase